MATNKEELLEQWLIETDTSRREMLLKELEARKLIPDDADFDNTYGLYPEIDDENFLMKLFHKREFAENKYESIEDLATCSGNVEFELSPVQRFISNFLSGKTPYYSALLYHGVGVGKTCSAISIAEANLYINPKKKVFIIAPPNIQPNFIRTIFDINNVIIPEEDNFPNTHKGCTGSLYLQLSGCEYEKDKKVIERKVKSLIKSRYEFMGYIQLASYIERLIIKASSSIRDPERRRLEEIKAIRDEFSGKTMIIDEAHNLRDIPGESEDDNIDAPGGDNELSDSAQGKKLTPSLTRVLTYALNMKFVLLTATPMYNSYLEIIFLLNLLLTNDKRATLKPSDIFNIKGDGTSFTTSGRQIFGNIVKAYISYMRGETPISFPIRLSPYNAPKLEVWPTADPAGNPINLTETELERLLNLPIVPTQYGTLTKDVYNTIVNSAVKESGLGVKSIDTLVQSGNFIFPVDTDDLESRIRETGFDNVFDDRTHSLRNFTRFASKIGPPTWLIQENLVNYSPKSAFIIKNIRNSSGPVFVYSRFIKSGALPFALALEANGYTPYGKDRGLLYDGIQIPDGRQCALCKYREKNHKGEKHQFIPAKYILLTGRKNISPNNNEAVIAERNSINYNGSDIKVVIGSQVASEGIDLKFIREIYVFDSWFHLNKMEQVLGRGIRTCSHIHPKISKEERNTTVYLLVNMMNTNGKESADLYMYRIGMLKALQTGKVQRAIKTYAIDCNLNINVNIIQGLVNTTQLDSQGNRYEKDINDQNYTNLCDWMECKYTCAEPVDLDLDATSDLTYDEYDIKWRESKIKASIKKIFQTQEEDEGLLLLKAEDITELFSSVPPNALFSILQDIINNKSFRLVINNKEGYLIYKNGFYLFQPIKINYDDIPLSMRIAQYPVKQDEFVPVKIAQKTEEVKLEEEVKIASEDKGFINKLWESIISMAQKIQSGTLENKLQQILIELIKQKYKSNPIKASEILNSFEMVFWLYRGLKDSVDDRKIFAYVFLDYIWDTLLNVQQQLILSSNDDEIIQKVAEEQLIQNGKYYRFLNLSEPYDIQYYCGNKLCYEAEKQLLEKDSKDPYNRIPPADKSNVGEVYGFLVPKARHLVFKTNVPAEVGKKPVGGQECLNTTSRKANIEFLYLLGKILNETIKTDLNLNPENIDPEKGRHKLKNPNEYCTIREFVLRMMDEKKILGKRWFYRPISAYKTNHKSRTTKAKA